MIRLEVLGKPSVKNGQREAKLYAKAVALLAYLALEGRTSRRKIAELLWVGSPDPLNNLSVTRGHIISELGEGALESDLETISLGSEVWCDALEWQKQPTEENWGLYRGEFLQDLHLREWKRGLGEEFEEWIEQKRTDFTSERSHLAVILAKDAIGSEKYLDAQKWLESVIGDYAEPQEEAARWLICLYGFQNQTDKAVRLHSKLSLSLKETLGVCPTLQTETAFLSAQDRRQQNCLDLLKKECVQDLKQHHDTSLEPPTPFVGRDKMLSNLLDFLVNKPNAIARAVGLVGEPGAGKSRLAFELARKLENHLDTKRYFVKATPEAPIATPIAELCRTVLQQHPNLINQLSMSSQKAIHYLLPDLYPKTNLEQDSNHISHLKNALQYFFVRKKTIILFDDLQWADKITVECIKYLLEISNNSLYLIYTQRNTEPSIANLEPIHEWGAKKQSLEIQALAPLEPNDLNELLDCFQNTHWDANFLKNASGGNPLYALELIRAKELNNTRVLGLIQQRIQRVGTLELQTLEGFAVLGGRSDLHTLGIVTGRSTTELIKATENLEYQGLLGNDQHKLYLNHDLTREAILQNLGLARRATLHLRAAHSQHKIPENAAYHYWESRNAWTPRDYRLAHQAFKYLAERNSMHGQFEVAIQWLEKGEATCINLKQKVDFLIDQVICLARYDKPFNALKIINQVKKIAPQLNNLEINAKILVIEARVLIRTQNSLDKVKILLDSAFQLVNKSKFNELKADIYTMFGYYYQNKNDLIQSLKFYDLGLNIRKSLLDQTKIEESLNNIASIYYLKHNWSEAKKIWIQLLYIREINKNIIGITSTLNNLIACSWQENNLRRALFYAKKSINLFKETRNFFELANAYENKSIVYFSKKNFAKSYKLLKKSMSIRVKNKLNVFNKNFCYNMAEIFVYLGNFKKFQIYIRKYWKILQKNNIMGSEAEIMGLFLESQIKIKQGKFNLAKQKLQKAASISLEINSTSYLEESHTRIRSIGLQGIQLGGIA